VKKQRFILDSYSLLAYLQAEPAGEKVRDILKQGAANQAEVLLSVINLGEIYYIIQRKRGQDIAQEIMQDISSLPMQLIDVCTKRVLAAADIKACYPISCADSFVVATAKEFSATIVSGDPDFKALDPRACCIWL
jgi:ribonuclease VapC